MVPWLTSCRSDTEEPGGTTEPAQNRPPVGYILATPAGPQGHQGVGYDYVIGRGGIYIQCESERLTARMALARTTVRGLAEVEEKLELVNGPIPVGLLDQGFAWMRSTPEQEKMFGIAVTDKGYELVRPEQQGTGASVEYRNVPNMVAQFHSHCSMAAFFSHTDNRDEQGFGIYGVLGRVNSFQPTLTIRLGIYGHYGEPDLEAVLSGQPHNVNIQAPADTLGFYGAEEIPPPAKERAPGFIVLSKKARRTR